MRRLSFALLVLLAACGREAPKPSRPLTVAAIAAPTAPYAPVLTLTGTVQTVQSVAVRSRVDGVIAAVNFREGDRVAAGQVLFRLDDRLARAQAAQAGAAVQRDQAAAAQTAADLRRAEALVKGGFVSAATLDQKRAAAQAAQASVGVDRAAASASGTTLDYLTIRAPITGRTGELGYKLGASVKGNDATALVTINATDPIDVRFALPPDAIAPVRAAMAGGLAVSTTPHNAAGAPMAGRLVFLDNNVDPNNGELAAKARFANPGERLWPGSLVDVRVPLGGERPAVALPEGAVQQGPSGAYVWVVGAGAKVAMRPVRVAGREAGRVFLAAGVAPGETVVTDALAKLQPGAAVKIAQGRTGPRA